jgi:hypothetical protein
MTRLLLITLSTLAVSACAVIDAPLGPTDSPNWIDERVAEGAETRMAPATVPLLTEDLEEVLRQRQGEEAALAAREALLAHERGAAPEDRAGEAYAEQARARTNPDQ